MAIGYPFLEDERTGSHRIGRSIWVVQHGWDYISALRRGVLMVLVGWCFMLCRFLMDFSRTRPVPLQMPAFGSLSLWLGLFQGHRALLPKMCPGGTLSLAHKYLQYNNAAYNMTIEFFYHSRPHMHVANEPTRVWLTIFRTILLLSGMTLIIFKVKQKTYTYT